MKLSIVIPAYNEALNLPHTLQKFYAELCENQIEHELLVINDNSDDGTEKILNELQLSIPTLRVMFNARPNGFGYAVRKGLENFAGDCVAIVMADMSDDPGDLVKF